MVSGNYQAAEFFAGIGLVKSALDQAGIEVVWANDIDPTKAQLYAANHPAGHYVLGDIRSIQGRSIPTVHLATASFPCTDLSLAGQRRGLAGEQSGMFWEFARVIAEMGQRRPPIVLLENVPALLSSKSGTDLRGVIDELNRLGYSCDALELDARWFVPQSRPRLFVVGVQSPLMGSSPRMTRCSSDDPLRPHRVLAFVERHRDLRWHCQPLPVPHPRQGTLASVVERFSPDDPIWWDQVRTGRLLESLSSLQLARLRQLRQASDALTWRTAYRRTRRGIAVWEVRSDEIAGCLRTARGGSSKQAVVEAGNGAVRVRWMTPREYARLQGVGDKFDFGRMSPNQVMFGFGDAVCVPAVAWIARHYLRPVLEEGLHEPCCA